MKKEIIAFIAICIIAYLLGCFISTSFNISNWDESLRGIIGVCGVLFGFMAMGIANDTKNTL